MRLARVVGTVVATVCVPAYAGRRLLLCDLPSIPYFISLLCQKLALDKEGVSLRASPADGVLFPGVELRSHDPQDSNGYPQGNTASRHYVSFLEKASLNPGMAHRMIGKNH